MDMIGDELVVVVLSCSAMAACGRLTPIGEMYVDLSRCIALVCRVLLLALA